MSQNTNFLRQSTSLKTRRSSKGILSTSASYLEHFMYGNASAMIYMTSGNVTLDATLEFVGSLNGVHFFPILVYPYYAFGGALPDLSQPLLSEKINAANVTRVYAIATQSLAAIRIFYSIYTSGAATIVITSKAIASTQPFW
jgi:hypothetical protein